MTIRTEENFLAQYAGLPDDLEVLPGLTVGDGRKMLRRPPEDPAGGCFVTSVAYSATAGDVGQMAMYVRRDASERAPVVAFVHGGGWASGHHFGPLRRAHSLASLGYVTASLTYRLADEAPWPAALEDTKCAVRWLRAHAHELGGDPDRIVVFGESAGGHLAALVALTPGWCEGDGGWSDQSSRVQGAFLVHPAVDLQAMVEDGTYPPTAAYFDDDLVAASPINRVTPACPPIVTVTGDADTTVPVAHVQRFHGLLGDAGVQQQLHVLGGRGHGFDLYEDDFALTHELLVGYLANVVGTPERGLV